MVIEQILETRFNKNSPKTSEELRYMKKKKKKTMGGQKEAMIYSSNSSIAYEYDKNANLLFSQYPHFSKTI